MVRSFDRMTDHPDGEPCVTSTINHTSFLNTYSPNVFVNYRNVGRVTDTYNGGTIFNQVIVSTQGTVFAN
jgi:hypothetical protein